jgi:heme-degrading monooxygenase HmoA
METVLIDTFRVPDESKEAFLEWARQAQGFIKTLPGFVEGFLYEQRDAPGSQHQVVTIAVWENEEAFEHARQTVAARDRQQGIDRQALLKQLGIELTRAIYRRSPY